MTIHRYFLIIGLFSMLLLLSCEEQTTSPSYTGYRVFGRIQDTRETGIKDIRLVMSGVGIKKSAHTQEGGLYAFNDIPSGYYTISVDSISVLNKGYRIENPNLDVTLLNSDMQVQDFVLSGPYVKDVVRLRFYDDNNRPVIAQNVMISIGSSIPCCVTCNDDGCCNATISLDSSFSRLTTLSFALTEKCNIDVGVHSASGTRLESKQFSLPAGRYSIVLGDSKEPKGYSREDILNQ